MSARTGEHPGARGWRVPRVTRHAVDGSAGRLHLVRDPEPVPDERHEEGSGAAPEPVRVDGLRLALVSDTYLPQVNGVTRTLDRLAREVAARGGAVEVFTAHDPRAADAEAALAERASRVAPGGREGGPRIHRHGSVPFWGYPELRLAAPGGRQLAGELARFGATLVHAATPFGMGLAARRA